MITAGGMAALKAFMLEKAAVGAYYASGAWHNVVPQSATVGEDGRVRILLSLPLTHGTITKVRLKDSSDNVLCERTEKIQAAAAGESILYRFLFTLTEG